MAAPRKRVVDTTDWVRSVREKAVPIAVFAVIAVGFTSLFMPMQLWFQQRQAIADLQVTLQEAKNNLKQMQVERQRWEDPVYIRSQARDRLYYVMPGEVSYLVMDASGANLSDVSGTLGASLAEKKNTSEFSESILQTKNNWMENVLESVVRSGIEEPGKASN